MDSCTGAPAGYVDNNYDCDDNDMMSYYQGAACSSGCDCITTVDAACQCAISDPDNDGICDGLDVCPGEDDKIDTDNNGIPDCAEEPC